MEKDVSRQCLTFDSCDQLVKHLFFSDVIMLSVEVVKVLRYTYRYKGKGKGIGCFPVFVFTMFSSFQLLNFLMHSS